MEAVCNFAGIGTSTFYRWMGKRREGEVGEIPGFLGKQ